MYGDIKVRVQFSKEQVSVMDPVQWEHVCHSAFDLGLEEVLAVGIAEHGFHPRAFMARSQAALNQFNVVLEAHGMNATYYQLTPERKQ